MSSLLNSHASLSRAGPRSAGVDTTSFHGDACDTSGVHLSEASHGSLYAQRLAQLAQGQLASGVPYARLAPGDVVVAVRNSNVLAGRFHCMSMWDTRVLHP